MKKAREKGLENWLNKINKVLFIFNTLKNANTNFPNYCYTLNIN